MRYVDAIVTVAALLVLAASGHGGAVRDGRGFSLVAEDGAAVVRYKDVAVGELSYVFWGPEWSWVDVRKQALPAVAAGERFRVDVAALGLAVEATIRQGAGELAFDFTLTASKPIDGPIRGGLELNLKLDSPVLAGRSQDVTLLPGERGCLWSVGDGQKVSFAFDQAVAAVTLEQGRKDKIRLYLVHGALRPGKVTRTLTVRLPAGGTVQPSIASRYGKAGAADWAPNVLPWNATPVDVGFLNDRDRPAGSHGRGRAAGDALVFADGTPARFWGTNVTAYALFTSDRAAVVAAAKRLAGLGYNLVRIHHHDSDWVSPNVIAADPTTQAQNPAALDAIDWWVKCLRDQGIYVWLDLKVGRRFRAGDAIPGFAELERSEPTGRGFGYVDERLQELQRDFAAKFLGRVNPYTQRSYLDDPAVLAVLLTNEDDLTTHFGNLMLPDKGNPVHGAMLRARVEASAERLRLSARQALRYWEPGDAKVALADVEAAFFARGLAALRALGFGGLVAGTNHWGAAPLYSLASLQVGDLVDVHAYGEAEALSANPRAQGNFIAWIGAAQIAGKPLSISEWNVAYPARDRFTAPLYVAAIAALQGWDAPMLFAYTQEALAEPVKTDPWATSADPALTALMPAAAVLFREQHVRGARKSYRFAPSRDVFYGRELTPDRSATLRTLVEQSRLEIVPPDLAGAAWDDRPAAVAPGAITVTDPDLDFIPPGQNRVRSDTGELERDWAAGVATIDTPRTQAAAGWIGGRAFRLGDVVLRIDTPKATVALTSLDGQPLVASRKILLTVVGQVAPSAPDRFPLLSQPVRGSLSLRSVHSDLVMTPVVPATARPAALRPVRVGDRLTFTLPAAPVTHWFLLEPRPRASPRRTPGTRRGKATWPRPRALPLVRPPRPLRSLA